MRHLNEFGFSIAEVVVATAIWSVLALGISYTVVSQKNEAINADRHIEAIDLGNRLSDYVNSNMFCEAILAATNTNNSRELRAEWRNLDIRNTKFTVNQGQNVQQNSTLDRDGRVVVTQARYRVKPGTASQEVVVTIGNKQERRRTAQIELSMAIRNNDGSLKMLEPRFIEVPVMTRNNYITSCDLKVTSPEICSALGMNFDTARSVCDGEGDMGCEFLGSFTRADLRGNDPNLSPSCSADYVNTVTGACDCPLGTNEQRSFGPTSFSTGTIQCGKKCSYTVYSAFEVVGCFRCGGN